MMKCFSPEHPTFHQQLSSRNGQQTAYAQPPSIGRTAVWQTKEAGKIQLKYWKSDKNAAAAATTRSYSQGRSVGRRPLPQNGDVRGEEKNGAESEEMCSQS